MRALCALALLLIAEFPSPARSDRREEPALIRHSGSALQLRTSSRKRLSATCSRFSRASSPLQRGDDPSESLRDTNDRGA